MRPVALRYREPPPIAYCTHHRYRAGIVSCRQIGLQAIFRAMDRPMARFSLYIVNCWKKIYYFKLSDGVAPPSPVKSATCPGPDLFRFPGSAVSLSVPPGARFVVGHFPWLTSGGFASGGSFFERSKILTGENIDLRDINAHSVAQGKKPGKEVLPGRSESAPPGAAPISGK